MSKNQQVRIIGGQHRGRKLSLADAGNNTDLRPTGDRIRETLFNWLQNSISGSYCLDLFTGSGALAIEALSRGANKVDAFDTNRKIITHLEQVKSEWKTLAGLQCYSKDALAWLENQTTLAHTIIFIDPPFKLAVQQKILDLICGKACTQAQYIYIETPATQNINCPSNCELLKQKKTGNVQYLLYLRSADPALTGRTHADNSHADN